MSSTEITPSASQSSKRSWGGGSEEAEQAGRGSRDAGPDKPPCEPCEPLENEAKLNAATTHYHIEYYYHQIDFV